MKMEKIIVERPGKVIFQSGDYVVKAFGKDFKKSDVLNEALNQSRVEETDLNIPKIVEITNVDGKWSIVMDYIKGVSLQELMDKNPQNMDEYLNKMVDLQLQMHAHTVPLLNKLKDKMERKINETKLSATIRYELHTTLNGMPKHNKLCHGDFNPSNIILGEDGKDYIIDWSHATSGNASADTARTYLLFKLAGQDELAEKYLTLFCEKSDTAKQYVQKWLPIVAASQSVKGKPEEREFLLSWVDIMDFE